MNLSICLVLNFHKIPVLLTSQVYSSFENGVRIVGGDILSYISKCLIELDYQNNKRKMVLKKHRSMASDKVAGFQIVNEGIIPL